MDSCKSCVKNIIATKRSNNNNKQQHLNLIELVTYILRVTFQLIETSFQELKSADHQRLESCEKLCVAYYYTSKIIAKNS